VIICPGPGETEAARAAAPGAIDVGPLDVGAFAALLSASRLVVANDSGPGHLGAAVEASILVIFGVTDPDKTCPRGPTVSRCGGLDAWPSIERVWEAVQRRLAGS
jgi:heptosyltransferase-2